MKMFSRAICLIILVLAFVSVNKIVYADEYVLPYPSFMPENKFYKISRMLDSIERWWFWGNIASVKYHLKLADKYLVEAKTLFEYRQYQLGAGALRRSDAQIPQIHRSLQFAQQEGKDVQKLKSFAVSAMTAHIGILEKLSEELPENFQWTPEKQASITINLSQLFRDSIAVREELLK